MSAWPALAGGMPDTATFEIGDVQVRSDVDVGTAKTRPRYTKSVDKVEFVKACSGGVAKIIRDFHKTTLVNGSLSFTWEHPLDDSAVTYRFLRPPTFAMRNGHEDSDVRPWNVGVSLELLP